MSIEVNYKENLISNIRHKSKPPSGVSELCRYSEQFYEKLKVHKDFENHIPREIIFDKDKTNKIVKANIVSFHNSLVIDPGKPIYASSRKYYLKYDVKKEEFEKSVIGMAHSLSSRECLIVKSSAFGDLILIKTNNIGRNSYVLDILRKKIYTLREIDELTMLLYSKNIMNFCNVYILAFTFLNSNVKEIVVEKKKVERPSKKNKQSYEDKESQEQMVDTSMPEVVKDIQEEEGREDEIVYIKSNDGDTNKDIQTDKAGENNSTKKKRKIKKKKKILKRKRSKRMVRDASSSMVESDEYRKTKRRKKK